MPNVVKYWKAVNLALAEEMDRDQSVVIFGEDVGAIGGPFGATKGLQKRFGQARVRDTPISEAAITGMAVGAALGGLRPVVEIMFMDFLTLALDQIVNQAAKMAYMSQGRYSVPLVVRTICGAHRGSGPQHSQHLESWLTSVPGIKVVWPSTSEDVYGLLKAAIRDPDPVVVVDPVSEWGVGSELDPGIDQIPIGLARTVRTGQDVTILTWGSAVRRSLAAAEQLADSGVSADVIDLRSLLPLDADAILDSVRRTGHLVIVHDAVAPGGLGAELIALVSERDFGALRAAPLRITPPFAPVPFPPWMEEAYYPGAERIADSISRAFPALFKEKTP